MNNTATAAKNTIAAILVALMILVATARPITATYSAARCKATVAAS